MRTCLSWNVSRCWQCTPHWFFKNGTEKDFASQWLITSPNGVISFKFYVKTPFSIIVFLFLFVILHLGHIQAVIFWPWRCLIRPIHSWINKSYKKRYLFHLCSYFSLQLTWLGRNQCFPATVYVHKRYLAIITSIMIWICWNCCNLITNMFSSTTWIKCVLLFELDIMFKHDLDSIIIRRYI